MYLNGNRKAQGFYIFKVKILWFFLAMAELDSAVITKTQETLGKYVKKPALTEKLLSKPPFRFLHDIITSVIRNSGFLDGLFEPEEMESANIKDKEAKILFLQKVIDVVRLSTKENVKAKPSKIVAGHEPKQTNELLQLIGLALDKKISSVEAVKLVRSNKVPETVTKSNKVASTKPNKIVTQSSVDSVKSKSKSVNEVKSKTLKENNKITPKTKESKENGNERPSRELKEKEPKTTRTSRDTKKAIKEVRSSDKTNSDKVKQKTNSESKKPSSKTSKEVSDGKLLAIETKSDNKPNSVPEDGLAANKDLMGEEVVTDNGHDLQQSFEPEIVSIQVQNGLTNPNRAVEDQVSEKEEIKSKEILHKEKSARRSGRKIEKINSENNDDSKVDRDLIKEKKTKVDSNDDNEPKEISQGADLIESKPPKPSRKTSIKAENLENIIPDKEYDSNEPMNNVALVATPSIPRPRTSLRPPSVRPASARPGAPRRRDRNIEIILQPDENAPKPSVNIKIDNADMDLEDDGENLVIIEDSASQLNLLNENKLAADVLNDIDGEQHGHLVQQILETQKEFSKIDDIASETQRKANIEWDSNNSGQRQSSAKQIDSLRDSIQKLTKSINPLGKLMDFLQEDIDSMQMELSQWKNSYANTKIELKREQGLTESAIEPLKLQLAHIESDIKDHLEIMNLAHVDIMENEEKIMKLLREM